MSFADGGDLYGLILVVKWSRALGQINRRLAERCLNALVPVKNVMVFRDEILMAFGRRSLWSSLGKDRCGPEGEKNVMVFYEGTLWSF